MRSGSDQGTTATVDGVWQAQRLWSTTANQLRRSLGLARKLALALTLTGAVLLTLGATVADFETGLGKSLGFIGAAALAVVPVVGARSAGPANVRNWVRARSVSEGLKAEIYCYLTRSGRYAGAAAPDVALAARRDELVGTVDDLALRAARTRPEGKQRPPISDVPSYVEHRLNPQVAWYHNRARELSTHQTWLRRVEYGLALVAAALGAAATYFEHDGSGLWAPVATTAATALAAHIAAERYENVILGYVATARRLEGLRAQLARGTDEQGDQLDPTTFVVNCENAISFENQEWMADWLEPATRA